MKKILSLSMDFYKGMIFPFILIFVIMTYGIYAITELNGLYRYITYTKELYKASELDEAYYFMPYYGRRGFEGNEFVEFYERYNKMLEKLQSYDIDIIKYDALSARDDRGIFTIYLINEENERCFIPSLAEGTWNTLCEDSPSKGEVIVGGTVFSDNHPGDSLTLNAADTRLDLSIAGKMTFPSYAPSLGHSGSSVDTSSFLKAFDNVIFCRETPQLREIADKRNSAFSAPRNFFVNMDNLNENDKEEVKKLLLEFGSVADYNEIITNTDKMIEYQIKTQLPIPLFTVIISTFSLISIAVLSYQKKSYEYSIWYLCGCNKKKIMLHMICSIGAIGLLAGGLNTALILYDPYLFRNKDANHNISNCIIDNSTILLVAFYVVIIIIISVIISFYNYYSDSPAEIKRRAAK